MLFTAARPVWGKGMQEERHINLGLYTAAAKPAREAILRVATSGYYRVFVNGEFVTYGPVRCAHGHYRVDEVPLTAYLTAPVNHVAIEVVNYFAYSFSTLRQPGFIQAELACDGKVTAATGQPDGFVFLYLTKRMRKIQRYSYQRPFGEAYHLAAGCDDWRCGKAAPLTEPVTWEETEEKTLLPRELALHTYFTVPTVSTIARGTVTVGDLPEHPRRDRSMVQVYEGTGYTMEELEAPISDDIQCFSYTEAERVTRPYTGETVLGAGTYETLALPGERTGFPVMELSCDEPTMLYFMVDEILDEQGDVDPLRLDVLNIIRLEIEPGRHLFFGMEPLGYQYVKLVCTAGKVTVKNLHMREVVHPLPRVKDLPAADDAERLVYEAAWQTLRQNAADVFTDCPTRERAGWLCDSFFIGRAAQYFTGDTLMEKQYLENFILPERFAFLPEGMLPMCYPSDHWDGTFIVNWSLWYVAELYDYHRRSGDEELIRRARPTVEKLFTYLAGLENEEGLLENLPSWAFVEWSKANEFVRDVNFPNNMVYAYVLRAAGEMYDCRLWSLKGEALRETVRARSFDGTFFVDNEVRRDGKLVRTDNRSETCQYHAFFFGIATPESHPALWKTLTEDFGPHRAESGKYPEIWPANAFTGNFLRLDMLLRFGKYDLCRREVVGYFKEMAARTGTLWEHMDTHASCNHGFASYVACLLDGAMNKEYPYTMAE